MKCYGEYTALERILAVGKEVKKTEKLMIWSILTTATIFDARSYRIPNQLIALGYTGGILLNIFRFGAIGAVYFILNVLWPLILLYLLYQLNGIGAGDIKLFSVASTLVGAKVTWNMMWLSVMLAGMTVVILMMVERQYIKSKLHYSFYMAAAFFLLQLT